MTEGTQSTPGTPGTQGASDRDGEGDEVATGRGPTAPAGDLEFDEAWSEPRQGHDVSPEPPSREVPSFEDPNDR